MDLHGYLRILRKNWWIILTCTVLGVGGAWFVNYRAIPTYQSSVTFYVFTPTGAAGGNAYQANQYAVAKIDSYTELLTSDRLANMIIDSADLTLSTSAVKSRISASSDLNTVLLTAVVTDTSPERSLAIANAIALQYDWPRCRGRGQERRMARVRCASRWRARAAGAGDSHVAGRRGR